MSLILSGESVQKVKGRLKECKRGVVASTSLVNLYVLWPAVANFDVCSIIREAHGSSSPLEVAVSFRANMSNPGV